MNKNRVVVPVQIIEEVTRKTLDESTISYIVCLPDEDRTQVDLDKIESKAFNSPEEVKQHMIKNANDAIDSIIEKSKKTANSFFGKYDMADISESNEEKTEAPSISADELLESHGDIRVDLGDGVKARIDLSGLENA